MKRILKELGLAAIAISLAAVSANATAINGTVSFSDEFTINTGSLATATAITGISSVAVSNSTGDYSGLAHGDTIDFSAITGATPFTFSPSTPFIGFWTVTKSGVTYSFDISTTAIDLQSSSALVLSGSGLAHITGYDDTVGNWTLTLNSGGGLLNFSGVTSVPDGGATLLLLGSALAGLGLIRRR